MSLSTILSRYSESSVLVNGGDQQLIDEVSKYMTVISWEVDGIAKEILTTSDSTSIIQIIVTNTGYLLGKRVETVTSSYLSSADAIIYHGYPEFKTEGLNVIKEVYTGGCVISPMIGEVYRLKKISELMPVSTTISTPFVYDPSMDPLLPYIHIYSRMSDIKNEEGILRIPTRELPPSTMDNRSSVPSRICSSLYADKDRKLLLAAIDLVSRNPVKDFVLLYYGDLYIKWVPYFIILFGYLNPTVHLWGKDQDNVIETTKNILIRPSDLGRDTPDIDLYLSKYGKNNNILLLSDDEDQSILSIEPRMAYIPYKGRQDIGDIVVLPWSTIGKANIRYVRGERHKANNVTQSNIDNFHYTDRSSSYNIGAVLDRELGVPTNVGRSLIVPKLGLCTCYDCASEVGIIARYMKARKIPYSSRAVEGLLKYNDATLWPVNTPMSKPSDRENLLLTRETIDRILSIDPFLYGNIGIDVDDDLLRSNTSLYIEGKMNPITRMREVIQGRRYPLIVNFHRDFIRNYSEDRDKGRIGKKVYDDFIQSVSLNKSSVDTYGMLILFITRNMPVVT